MSEAAMASALPVAEEGRPLHLQIKAAIAADLVKGTWKPGEKLPTEAEIALDFGVSEGTVRQAVIALVKEGRLTRRSGKGTFAAKPNFDRSFERFYRFRDGQDNKDSRYGVHVLGIKTTTVAPDIAKALGCRVGTKVTSIHRAIKQNEITVCHSISYFRQEKIDGLTDKDLEDAALYDVLRAKFGTYVVRVTETLKARVASEVDCEIFKVKRNSPVISIERHAYTYEHQVVEVRQTIARSDEFSYRIELR
jgi:GntR family transcriptional regulator